MTHRFSHLAKKYVAPLWECVQSAITDLKELLAAGAEEAARIARALRNAEDMARDALVRMAQELMVFPAKPRATSEGFASVPTAPKVETRPPMFRLGLEAVEQEIVTECAEPGEQYEQHVSKPSYAAIEIFERRLAALEDVLSEPGRHAARMKRALHKREDDSSAPIILKDPDTVLLDHIDRFIDDPEYSGTGTFRQLHTKFIDTS